MRRSGPFLAAWLLLLGCLPTPALAAPGWAFVDPTLRLEFSDGRPRPVILVLDPGASDGIGARLGSRGLPFHVYDRLDMVAVVLGPEDLDPVAALAGVVTVYRNEHMRPYLDKAAGHIGATVVWNTYRDTGAGATTLVVDTGIDGTHPDLRFGANLVENVLPTRDPTGLLIASVQSVPDTDFDGHGTHVAGLVAGTGKALGASLAGRYKGIAYGGNVIGFAAGIPALQGSEPSFDSVTVLEAFNWGLKNAKKFTITTVTNSWGANGPFEPRSPVNQATLNLYKAGLVVTFAAGNEGEQGSGTLNRFCVAPWVVCVGAGDYFPRLARFSSRGVDPAKGGKPYDHPDIVGPGVGLTSARTVPDRPAATGGLLPPITTITVSESSLYAQKSGTSMATPVVAGVVGLLVTANPSLSPDDVMDILIATAAPMPGYKPWEVGAGYVQALQAYRLAVKTTGHRDEFLQGKGKYGGAATGDPSYARDAFSVGYGNGTARAFRALDTSLSVFATRLVTSPFGLTLLVGAILLSLSAFRLEADFRKSPPPPQALAPTSHKPETAAPRPPQ